MPTVIDALIITLGLDRSDFEKGSKAAQDASRKTQRALQQQAKDAEEAGKKIGQSFEKATRAALGFFAILVGAKSLSDFVGHTTTANAALGRFGTNIGASTKTIQAWGAAAERVGGTMEGTSGSFERMSQALYALHNSGKALPQELYRLSALTGIKIDTERGPVAALEGIAAAAAKLAKTNPSQTFFLLKESGLFDEGTINLMVRHGDAIKEIAAGLERYAASEDAIKAATKLQSAWAELSQTTRVFANRLYEVVGPALADIVKQVNAWIEANREWMATEISKGVEALVTWAKQLDWKPIVDGAREFADALGGVRGIIQSIVDGIQAIDKFGRPVAELLNRITGGPGKIAATRDAAGDGEHYKTAIGSVRKGSIADWIAGKISGERAAGGPVSGGKTYLVGERGPELFVPGSSGAIVPNHAMGGDTSLQVGGRDVSRGNPLPVTIANLNAGAEKSIWEKAADFLGISGGGGSGAAQKAAAAVGGVAQAARSGGGSRSWRNNNPGNIEYGPFAKANGAIGSDGRFAIFPDYKTGRGAQERLLFESKGYRDLTLSQAIARWAPGSDNNVPAYIKAMGGDPGLKMHEYSPEQRAKLLDAMQRHEGWTPGNAAGLNVKPGAGTGHAALMSLGKMMQDTGMVNRFTAFQDAFHRGRPGSLHNQGLAGDFSLKDPRNSAAAAQKVRDLMDQAGLGPRDYQVIDEYANPSRGSTGGHIHYAFRSAQAAAQFQQWRAAQDAARARAQNVPPGVSLSTTHNAHPITNNSTANMNIGQISVNAPNATDAQGVASGMNDALARSTMPMLINRGQI